MKTKIKRTKTGLYILLAVLTVIFASISFRLYCRDIESRLNPQVERAIIQACRLLPQLEENENALREISLNLEENRKRLISEETGLSDEQSAEAGKNVETVIHETISWLNRITKLRVGRAGHVTVVSQNDYTILAHPDERFVGEKVHLLWGNLKLERIPDLKELGGNITRKDLPEDYYLFLPDTFFMKDPDSDRYYAAVGAGAYGSVFAYEDTFIICGVTLTETLTYVVVRCLFSTMLFLVTMWVFVRYVGFCLDRHEDEQKMFLNKIIAYAVMSVISLFCIVWYYQSMMDVTGDIATMNDHAKVAVETLNTYHDYRTKLTDWLDGQYLEQCRLAADLVKERGKENLTRKEVAEFAEELGVEYIYVYDKDGKVLVTNSPYDHFVLSSSKEDPSYAFRPLLDGREYVIQDVGKDDFGDKKQYIGVSIRDEKDLSDGFVQIVVSPQLRDRLLEPINVQGVLDILVIGLPKYALAVDKETMKITATTGLGYENAGVEELGIDPKDLEEDYNEVITIGDKTYYTGVSKSENLYLIPLVESTDNTHALFISCILALVGIVAFFIQVMVSQAAYGRVTPDGAAPQPEASGIRDDAGEQKQQGEKRHLLDSLFGKVERSGLDARWKRREAVPLEEQTPEMRVEGIIYRVILVFATVFLLFEIVLIYAGTTKGVRLDGFSYVLLGNWEKGLHLFSLSYCLFLLCVLYVFRELLNHVLYSIAKISDLKRETILLLLRSAVKYACALIFLYIGLAKFGVDTRALWASAGVLSLMIGFGAKDLIGDIIAGLFIIFEGTYKIGDWVTVGSWSGNVEEIGIRYTKISRGPDTRIFNNSSIRDLVTTASNSTMTEKLLVPIPYETDILEVEKLLERELPAIGERIPGLVKPLKYQGIDSLDDGRVTLRIAADCERTKSAKVLRELRREIKLLFDRNRIIMPYKHILVSTCPEENNTCTEVPGDTAAGKAEGGTKG